MAIEITKNYIKSGISENNSEAGVKILKERRGVKCGSVVDSSEKCQQVEQSDGVNFEAEHFTVLDGFELFKPQSNMPLMNIIIII